MNAMEGSPSWRMISLKESSDRRNLMIKQFDKYNVKDYSFFITERWDNLHPNVRIKYHSRHSIPHHGSCISHLESMRQWYLTTNEPYAIFSDDDIDLSTCEHWNFTFKEFIENLPYGWECIQLMRLHHEFSLDHPQFNENDPMFKFELLLGRWWGVCALMTREYVKSVLDRHYDGTFDYDLRVSSDFEWDGNGDYISYVENVLFLENGKEPVGNFPLFVELINDSTVFDSDERKKTRRDRTKFYHDKWKRHGSKLNIKEALMPT